MEDYFTLNKINTTPSSTGEQTIPARTQSFWYLLCHPFLEGLAADEQRPH